MSYEREDIKHLLRIMGYSEGAHFTVDTVDGEEVVEWISEQEAPTMEEMTEVYDEIIAEDGSLEARRWAIVRQERTDELYRTDWVDLPSCPYDAPTVSAYLNWRQELRDVPQDYTEIDEAEAQLPVVIATEPTV